MARIKPFLGDIEGSAGNVTFVKTGGVNILKQKIDRNTSNSPAQQAQRSKFGGIGRFARKMSALLSAGYKRIGLQTGYSRFIGINSSAATLDVNGMPLIDYGMIEVSSGNNTPLVGLAVSSSQSGQTVSWTDNSNATDALGSDKVYLVIVKKSTGDVITQLGSAIRSAGTTAVASTVLAGVAASDLAVYAFAKRVIGGEASPTTRLGGGTGAPAVTYSTTLTGPSQTAANTTITSAGAEKLEFNELTSGTSGPYNMLISVGGVQKASIDTFDRYAGRPFRFTEANGTVHTGVVAAAVNF